MNASQELDVDELFHLALDASNRDQHEQAISLLKRAIAAQPEGGKQHYLLGAEYAQIGLYDRAVDEFAASIRLAPELHTARFQMGLLLMTLGNTQGATDALAPLEALDEKEPLRHFAAGLRRLAEERLTDAQAAIERGIVLNVANPALSKDMEQVIQRIKDAVGSAVPAPETAGGVNHLLLNTYAGKNSH